MAKKNDAGSNLRNIGIMAHIDAGKTTLSERLLFITGKVHRMGEVHEGQAVMDWMPQEQERGITITSAVTSFDWNGHEVHLIDTPGHVDFTIEVERSLRVLDGVVTVLDGVEGVEPQTETVWDQANRFNVPRLVFINKLDRFGASFQRCVDSLRASFPEFIHLPIQIPIGLESAHVGFVDLLTMRAWTYDGQDPSVATEIPVPADLLAEAKATREATIEALADFDNRIAELFLEGSEVPEELLHEVIRKATIARQVAPLLCGSALKNKGIPPILDAVVRYLPSPADLISVTGIHPKTGETITRLLTEKEPFCALAFKVQMQEDGRRMTYLRIYSGRFSVGDALYNATRNLSERVSRVFQMHSSDKKRIESAGAGSIVGVLGLKLTGTGDTLCDQSKPLVMESIKGYEPVVHQALEPETLADKEKMEESLQKMAEEDPTFRTHEDQETGQRLIAGMGELHLEIIVDRLRRQFGLQVRVGKPQVVFRETIGCKAEAEGRFDRTHEERRVFAVVKLRVEPLDRGTGLEFANTCEKPFLTPEYLEACRDGAMDVAKSGPLHGYQMADLRMTLLDTEYLDGASTPVAFRIAAAEAARKACAEANPLLMEPIMALEISVPEENLGDAISSINERRGSIGDMSSRGNRRVVSATVALRRMFGYSSDLRNRTQGRGVFMMKFSHYDVTKESAIQ